MIYFIEAENLGMVKIGYATKCPDTRLAELQVGSPVKLLRLALMAGDAKKEREIHRAFARQRSHGEWFVRDSDLAAFIHRDAEPWVVGDYSRFWSEEQKEAARVAKAAMLAECRIAVIAIRPDRLDPGPLQPLPSAPPERPARRQNIDLKRLRAELDARGSA